MPAPRRLLAVLAAAAGLAAAPAAAAPLSCSAAVPAPATVRAEGLTERLGDLVLTCTGGTPTATGVALPRVSVTVFLDTAPTGRILRAPWSEALLLVDEPAPAQQRACATADGACPTVGNGAGTGRYDGAPDRPNVFQGQQAGNAISWPAVPFDPPGAGVRVLRLTNMRVDATRVPAGDEPAPIAALVTASGEIAVPITNASQVLGVVDRGLAVELRDALSAGPLAGVVSLPQCEGAQALRIATLRFAERFPGAFRTRAAATTFAAPALVEDQSVPGAAPATETGFLNAALAGHPARGALGSAGLADFGTRLKAAFASVPAGVSVFVDVAGASLGGDPANTARLTGGEWSGFDAAAEADGIPGTAPVPIAGGAGAAVWEITDADPLAASALELGVYVTYAATGPGAADIGTAAVRAGFAPAGAEDGIPRFADGSVPASLFSVIACDGAPSLAAAVLPGSRTVKVGASATVFATVINAGTDTARACTIAPLTTIPGTVTVRTTDAGNRITGSPPVDIPLGTAQGFLLAIKPTGALSPVDVRWSFDCANSDPAPVVPGVNTLAFSAAAAAPADVVALAATAAGDGIVVIPGPAGSAAFAVATVNMGSAATITVSADTGSAVLPVRTAVCATDAATGACLAAPAASLTLPVAPGATPTFGVFVTGSGIVPFLPSTNRVFVRFKDGGGALRGATSVALETR